MKNFTFGTKAALVLGVSFVGIASVLAGEPPAGMLICVNDDPVAPYEAIEVQAGVKSEWPSLNIAPFKTGKETFEEVQAVSATYQPASTDLESDELEAIVEAGGNTLTVDFDSARRVGKIRSHLLDFVGDDVPVGDEIFPATLELAEESIQVGGAEESTIQMSCVAILN